MKTVFITGASTDIGKSIATLFYQNQYNVAFIDTNSETIRGYCKDWDANRFLFSQGSVTMIDDLRNAVVLALRRFKRIDTLVLNSEIHRSNTVLSVSSQELDDIINVNVKGYINAIKAIMPDMISSGGGTILINISNREFIGKQDSFAYSLTKGAIAHIIQSIAKDYEKSNITISGVYAGAISPVIESVSDLDYSQNLCPMPIANASDVAKLFLSLSEEKSVSGVLHRIGATEPTL